MDQLITLLGGGLPPREELADRYRGTMLGVAVGNALGLHVEGASAATVAERFGHITDIDPKVRETPWDDDLAQTVVLAEALLEGDDLDLDDLARRLLAWREANGRGIGALTWQVLDELEEGTPAHDAARVVWERTGRSSAGNGAVMRCWPVALRWLHDPERLVREARTSALVTHHDPRCEWSTVASVMLAAGTLLGRDLELPRLARALEEAGAPGEVTDALRAAEAASLDDLALDDPFAMGYTLKAMQVAAWAGRQEPDVARVLSDVVSAGGDTDTNGAVAGAIMGARLGARAIPQRWIDAIPRPEDLVTVADDLLTRVQA